jgi:putative ABC transport system substrate-binding protein
VFGFGGDPVQTGLVASLNKPGGNITGVVTTNVELTAKRLGLLHELVPGATRFAVLVNASNSASVLLTRDALAAAALAEWQIEFLAVSTNRDLNATFASFAQKRVEAVMVAPELLFVGRRIQLLTLAARHAVPVIYPSREFAEAGGLMSYGSSFTDMHRQVGIYAGRILKGEKPADLPVQAPTKYELVINLKTAKALGLEVPPTVLARADEVIE